MQSAMKCRVLLLVALPGTGCVSIANAPRLPAAVVARIHATPSPHYRACVYCDSSASEFPVAREKAVAEVKQLLSASPWFDSVDADRAEASLIVSVQPLERAPYYESPTHNPGLFLLALVIPIPWELRTGYRMSASVPGSGASVQVDTRRTASAVMWSLAPLLNLGPNRSFEPSSERELARIHAQLLPLLEPSP